MQRDDVHCFVLDFVALCWQFWIRTSGTECKWENNVIIPLISVFFTQCYCLICLIILFEVYFKIYLEHLMYLFEDIKRQFYPKKMIDGRVYMFFKLQDN